MSETELLSRKKYKERRKKWLIIQSVALVIVILFAQLSFMIYNSMNRTYYVEYTESSNIDYQVQYVENEFFEEPWLDENQTYISFLIKNIFADFQYKMNMGAANVNFDYTYSIHAKMEVADKDTGNPYYTVEEALLPCQQKSANGSNVVQINELIEIDYHHFNDMAKTFTSVYGLVNASSTLIVTLDVQVMSTCNQFNESNENTYSTSINIPLNEETMSIFLTSSVPTSENKVLARPSVVSQKIFLAAGYFAVVLAVALALFLLAYMRLTRNEDVTYTARVRKLTKAYSSYIQRMEGDFDDQGYQILMIKTFNELLGIRDTLQAPILMTENRDKTMSRFLIPTDSKLLYTFEIKVDNYDEIYGTVADRTAVRTH